MMAVAIPVTFSCASKSNFGTQLSSSKRQAHLTSDIFCPACSSPKTKIKGHIAESHVLPTAETDIIKSCMMACVQMQLLSH